MLVGHSFGARVAVAGRTSPAAVVLVAPALGPLSFLNDAALESWRLEGPRPATRPHPETGVAATFHVPVSFAEDVLELEAPTVPDIPVLAVCVTSDARQNAVTRQIMSSALNGTVTAVDGPHRFWENPDALDTVIRELRNWRTGAFPAQAHSGPRRPGELRALIERLEHTCTKYVEARYRRLLGRHSHW